MSETGKTLSERDYQQTLRKAYNDVDATLSVNGFLVGKVGHKVTLTIQTTTIASDTELFSFYDNATLLYQLKLIYTDGARSVLLSAERVA
jgi:hypothetical protein